MAARAAGILVLTNMLPKGDETQCLYVAVNFGDEDEVGAKTEANNALAWLLKPADTCAELNLSEKTEPVRQYQGTSMSLQIHP